MNSPGSIWVTLTASLNGLILHDGGVNKSPTEGIDTWGIAYNHAAIDALLEEPVVHQPNIISINIPAAKEVSFIAEDGVGDEGDHEDDRGPEEVAVEAEEAEAADVEEEVDTTGEWRQGRREKVRRTRTAISQESWGKRRVEKRRMGRVWRWMRGIKCGKLLVELLVGRGQGAVASAVYNNDNRIRLLMAVNVKHEESRK